MNFKELRTQNEVKQLQIVNKLKISKGCISLWENGKRQPKIEQLPELAKILNCSIEEIVLALIATKKQNRGAVENGNERIWNHCNK